ncbi:MULTISPECIES: FeoA family protein [Pseudoalteromonas]|uniref:Iron transporter FeoA n=1 Tax=Pseudoalteromonas amylolytica TaxID=1859457 RepID=A0A1S1MU73_9GAMM|nr:MULTISPECIES: FeoA family protein [Pseudoalteromonas]MCF6437132.1 ferrous iron transport protein A [Pseudoalteromonas sp. MMG022]OHU90203.1 iron transporter FeoA [Pseudoalteromonas sp. JW3]OHU92430.1 iron transporter FeoA [Pseudoalteromonas amylolytica]
MTLNELKFQQKAVIAALNHQDIALASRIMALGLVPGETIELMNVAPMGCPLQVKVGDTLVSVRKSDASLIALQTAK